MDNAVLVGMYTAQPSAEKLGVPVLPDCVGWQAWQTPEGELLMQPVDAGGLPVGSLTVLDAEDFQRHFIPLETAFDAGSHTPIPLLSASDPDLLFWWFEKSLEEKRHTRRGRSAEETSLPYDYRAVVSSPGNIDPAAIYPYPLESGAPATAGGEEDAFGVTAPGSPGGALPPGAAVFAAGADTPAVPLAAAAVSAAPPLAAPVVASASLPTPPLATHVSLSPSEEERARILENATRAEFGMLLERWRAEPSTENLSLVEELLARPGRFGWQQKYMFSEFGLALRKEKLHALALQSHVRALELSPQDEHVLFNVARSLNELGRVAEAKEHLWHALSIAPDFETARQFLQFLEGALPAS